MAEQTVPEPKAPAHENWIIDKVESVSFAGGSLALQIREGFREWNTGPHQPSRWVGARLFGQQMIEKITGKLDF